VFEKHDSFLSCEFVGQTAISNTPEWDDLAPPFPRRLFSPGHLALNCFGVKLYRHLALARKEAMDYPHQFFQRERGMNGGEQ